VNKLVFLGNTKAEGVVIYEAKAGADLHRKLFAAVRLVYHMLLFKLSARIEGI